MSVHEKTEVSGVKEDFLSGIGPFRNQVLKGNNKKQKFKKHIAKKLSKYLIIMGKITNYTFTLERQP